MFLILNFFASLFGRSAAPEAPPEMPWQLAARQCEAMMSALESPGRTATNPDEETL